MKTTKRHFALFEAEIERLWDAWGMTGWDLMISHIALSYDRMAQTDVLLPDRRIRISLATELESTPSDAELKGLARHEMIHALLEPLQSMGREREYSQMQHVAASHEVLYRLSRLLP